MIIDASKGIISIEEIVSEYENLYTSLINYIEVLGYNFSDEKEEQIIEIKSQNSKQSDSYRISIMKKLTSTFTTALICVISYY